ncbi:MAG: hypothetical protein KQH57_06520 [Actinomycetales bacterium]|nr:hypothetical protein [Actinomycetales bacterium]
MSAPGRHAPNLTARHGAGVGTRRRPAAHDAPRRVRAGVVVALLSLVAAVAWALAGLPEARAAVQGWVGGPDGGSAPVAAPPHAPASPAPGTDGLVPELAARFTSARASAGQRAWHFEVLVAPGGTCPATSPDAAALWR